MLDQRGRGSRGGASRRLAPGRLPVPRPYSFRLPARREQLRRNHRRSVDLRPIGTVSNHPSEKVLRVGTSATSRLRGRGVSRRCWLSSTRTAALVSAAGYGPAGDEPYQNGRRESRITVRRIDGNSDRPPMRIFPSIRPCRHPADFRLIIGGEWGHLQRARKALAAGRSLPHQYKVQERFKGTSVLGGKDNPFSGVVMSRVVGRMA